MTTAYDRIVENFPTFFLPVHYREKEEPNLLVLEEKMNTTITILPKTLMDEYLADKPVRHVVCAANLLFHEKFPNGQLIVTGVRHSDPIMNAIFRVLRVDDGDFGDAYAQARFDGNVKQGFVDQWGTWMDRVLSLQVALAGGQPINWERNVSRTELYSEGLY